MLIKLKVNGVDRSVDVSPEMPLLWVIRETLGLTGTKYGCGESLCGACTVHLDGEAVRSCSTTVAEAANKSVTTIEGLDREYAQPRVRYAVENPCPQLRDGR